MTLSLTYETSADHPYTFPERHTENLKKIELAFNSIVISGGGTAHFSGYLEGTFTNSDLVTGTLTIVHNLDTLYPEIFLYDNNREIYVPDRTKVIDANTIEVDINYYTPITGTWYYVISKPGITESTSMVLSLSADVVRLETQVQQISSDISNSFYDGSFTNSDIYLGKLNIAHNLNSTIPGIVLFDNNKKLFFPVDVTVIDENVVELDLQNYLPITGTWLYSVRKSGYGNGTIQAAKEQSITISGGNYTLASTPIIYANNDSGILSIAVPDPALFINEEFTIKYINTGGTVSLDAGAKTIDGDFVVNITQQYKYKKIHSNGIEWFIIGEN